MSYGVFDIKIPSMAPLPGIVSVLPNLGVAGNALQGTTSKGLLSVIFPNGEALLAGFGMLASDMMPSIFKKVSGVDIKPHIPELPGEKKGLLGGFTI